jgi:hypothetical protein
MMKKATATRSASPLFIQARSASKGITVGITGQDADSLARASGLHGSGCIQARSASKGDGKADRHGFSRQADASAARAR